MRMQKRLDKLEARGRDTLTVFADVPLDWSRDEAARKVTEAARRTGVEPPFDTFPVHIRGLSSVRIIGTGSMSNLLTHVAIHGGRLTVNQDANQHGSIEHTKREGIER